MILDHRIYRPRSLYLLAAAGTIGMDGGIGIVPPFASVLGISSDRFHMIDEFMSNVRADVEQ